MSESPEQLKHKPEKTPVKPQAEEHAEPGPPRPPVPEIGGQSGPDPTRFGDWEKNGRCSDF